MQLIPSQFSTFHLTEDEQLNGSILTETQKAVLINWRTQLATVQLATKINVNNITESVQDESYRRGQIDLITCMLETADVALEELQKIEQRQVI